MTKPERQSYVALLDVLGFRNLVKLRPLRELAAQVGSIKPRYERAGVHRIQFSDSVLLYTKGLEDDLFLRIVAEAADMIGENAKRGIYMRGAVTAGEFYHDGDVFLGEAMVRAYELEQQQDWMGGIVDPVLIEDPAMKKVLEDLHDVPYLMPYPAPIKGGSVGDLECLGWPWAYETADALPLPGGGNWDARRKIHNTNEFLAQWDQLHPGWLPFTNRAS